MRVAILHANFTILLLFVGCDGSVTTDAVELAESVVITETEYQNGEYLWRPRRITMTLHDGDHLGTKGQYILLENNLGEDEYGWGSSILDLPDSWKIIDLRFVGLAIHFENDLGERFRIQPPKLNDLDFDILDGGDKADEVLETLWRRYALLSTTQTEQGVNPNP